MKTVEEIALEVKEAYSIPIQNRDIIDICEAFLAAVDAERGKDAAGVLCISHFQDDPGMENFEFQPMQTLPPGQYPLFLSPTIPPGFALVPIEPTLDMGWSYLDAARESSPECEHVFNHPGYRAMIQAAGVTK